MAGCLQRLLKKQLPCGPAARLLALLALGSALWLTQPLPTVAQDPQPDKPSRTGNLVAPEREPVVKSVRILSPVTVQTVVEFAPVADAYIASNYPDENFGGADGLFLGYSYGGLDYGAERILVRFDALNGLPGDITINDARLRLYLSSSNPGDDAPMDTVLRRAASFWAEDSVTWNSEPIWGGVRASPNVGDSPGWYEWNITNLVADWVQGVYSNYGVEIIGDEQVRLRERIFFARETVTDFYPRLIVDYTEGVGDDLPPAVTIDPLPSYASRNFLVSWSGSDQGTAGIAYYDVQYRVDGGDWRIWLSEVTDASRTFTGAVNGRLYQFRARGVDNAGNAELFGAAEAQTTVDVVPPSAEAEPLPLLTRAPSLTVYWSGSDATSGIHCYDVQYRLEDSSWILLKDCTTDTSYTFAAPAEGRFAFEVRAIDLAGNQEPFTYQPEAITIVDNDYSVELKRVYLPIILREAN